MLKFLLPTFIFFTISACSTKNIHPADAIHSGIPEFSIDKNVEEADGGFFFKNEIKTDTSNNTNLGPTLPCLNNTDFTIMKSVCMSRAHEERNAYKPQESIEFEAEKLAAYQKEHHIDLKTIVSSDFTQQVQQFPELNNKIKENAKLKFKMGILKYGLDEVLATPGVFMPMLSVKATLTDADGEIIWEQTQGVDDSDVPKFKYAEYYAQPENFQSSAWASAAKVVVNKLIIDLLTLDSNLKK